MTPDAQAAIHAVRMKRLRQALQALETALAEGETVSKALLEVSGLLERGIDPRQIRSTFGDVPRLLNTARTIEAKQLAEQTRDPRRPPGQLPV